jgi:UDP-N-acetylglucosamine--N-acetylmuramyl-(pentapeptide) pyrophosphoryl-undecaprenol N-acetylglucosamine transferase
MMAAQPSALIMAGGTGGHIYPGLAVADELRRRGWRIVWLGNADGMEGRIVPPRGYELQSIRFTALRGKGLLRKLMLPLNLLRGFWQALGVLGASSRRWCSDSAATSRSPAA